MKMRLITHGLAVFPVLLSAMVGVYAQEGETENNTMPMNHDQMDHGAMNDNADTKEEDAKAGMNDGNMMDHDTMNHGAMADDSGSAAMQGMSVGNAMPMREDQSMTMDMSGMQGGGPPADARDPHAYSDGVDFFRYPIPQTADEENFTMLSIDRFETVVSDGENVLAWDVQGWYGRDFNRVVIKSEGDYDNGSIEEASTDLLWSHAVAGFWNTQVGVRYDTGEAPDRSWLAFGIQGLAPYWFEVDATGYLGENGQTAFSLEAEYDLFLTQKWILQPRLEANFYGKSEPEFGLGSGLNDLSAGLRLQYQFRREVTAYAGAEWEGLFGDARNMARANGRDGRESRFVAGMRLWF